MNHIHEIHRIKIPMRWDPTIVMYLVIVDWIRKEKVELLKARATDRFFEMVREHVAAHVLEGKEPPAAIAAPIMNIADDVMSGREVGMRAGDYITLMEFARKNKMV
jgi:hypothetical protein